MVTERELMNAWFDQASHGWRKVRLKPAERTPQEVWPEIDLQRRRLEATGCEQAAVQWRSFVGEKTSWVLPQFQHKLLSSSSVCVSMDGCYGDAGG
ncbi:unnamed protein product [Camellia sinensis]